MQTGQDLEDISVGFNSLINVVMGVHGGGGGGVTYPWFVVDLATQLTGEKTPLDVFSRQTKGTPTTV